MTDPIPRTDDIVADLRSAADRPQDYSLPGLLRDAADRIEELEELLDRIAPTADHYSAEGWMSGRREAETKARANSPEGHKRAEFADFLDSLINPKS